MKTWIRIVVAFSVVVIIGFALWAFFFDEKDEIEAYNDMTQMLEFKESIGLEERIIELRAYNYVGEDKSALIENTSEGASIVQTRNICLSTEIINEVDEDGDIISSYMSYSTYDTMSVEMFKDILPYLNGTTTNNKARKAICSSIKNYIKQLKEVSEKLDLVLLSQKDSSFDPSSLAQLSGAYTSFKNNYKKLLVISGDVIADSINYINIGVYGKNYKSDTNFALYDCFARTLKAMSSSDEKNRNEVAFSHNSRIVAENVIKVLNNENIFTEYSELQFLKAYNDLLNNHTSVLNDVFSTHYINVVKMADNDANSLSAIKNEAKESLVIVLNTIGF